MRLLSELVASTGQGTPYVGCVLGEALSEKRTIIVQNSPDDVHAMMLITSFTREPVTPQMLPLTYTLDRLICVS
jgi:hypothetical protein